ncbi:hypothetical protein B5M09_003349 [Aphanomyces astaci]|uniref:Adenylate kinase n=1 Tax=Aphanomyces astaci TaxID=112090 RepID=A0A3R7XTN7_APHAT|nr:hypothetical protein B5M09_003349 [Aphanomyces astaci]
MEAEYHSFEIDHVLQRKGVATDAAGKASRESSSSLWALSNIAIPLNYICIGLIITFPNAFIEYYPRQLGASDSQLSTIGVVRNLPWTFKVLYGVLADVFPIAGHRFKPYMVLGYAIASIFNLLLAQYADNMSVITFTTLLFFSMLGLIMVDVMADALLTYKAMAEPEGSRGHIQGTIYMLRFLTETVGYWGGSILSNRDSWGWGLSMGQCFGLLALLPVITILPFLYFMDEPVVVTVLPFRGQMAMIWKMLCLRATWQPLSFIVLYHTLHTYNAAWGNFLQVRYAFNAFEYGSMAAVGSTVGFLGVFVYKRYLLDGGHWHFVYTFASVVIAIFSVANIVLVFRLNEPLGLPAYWFAMGDSAIMKFAYGVQYLPSAIMFTRVCPEGQEAVAYALLTGFSNLSGGFASTISNALLGIWPVQLEDMKAGEIDGIWKLTVVTSVIRLLALPFIPYLLPNSIEALDRLKQPHLASRVGGACAVAIYAFGFVWVVIVSFLAITSPCLQLVGDVIAEDLPPMEITPLSTIVPMSYVFDDVEHRTISGIIHLQYQVRRRQSCRRNLAKSNRVPLATTDAELREWHGAARGKVHSSEPDSSPIVVISPKYPPRRPQQQQQQHPLRLVICGPPAGGKGTQCERLVEKYGVVHLSTGDMLRAAIQVNSNTGLRAKQFMDAGTLVPDDLIVHVILERLQAPDCAQKGWLLDGFPRTPVQAKAMVDAGIVPDLVLVLHVPDDEVVARISGRRVDLTTGKTYHVTFNPPPPGVDVVQRSDDNEETIRVRLATYHANCDAVVDTFVPLSTILHVDGMLPKPGVVKSVDTAIEVVETIARKGGGYADEELSLSESDHLRLAKKAVLRHAAVASQTHQPPTVAVLGPPGSGKSYHCHWLHEHLGVVHFSVGEMLRRSIDAETRVGVKAKVYVEVGDVVPDSLIVGTTVEILRARECRTNGWALDGFPRTSGQAKALVEHDIVPDIVVVLDVVDDNEVVHRISGRRFDPVTDHTYHVTFDPPPPGVDVKLRTDDTEGAVRLSLAQYRAHCVDIEAVLAAHTKVVHVDGCLSKAQVHAHLSRLFPSLKAKGKHPTQPSGLRPPRGFHHGHHPTSLMKAASSLKPLKLPPTVLAAYSPPKTNRPKSTHNDDDDKTVAGTSAATDDDIQAALAELHEIQVENVRLKQLFLDTSKHPSKEGMSKPRQGNRGGGDREYDVVLEQLASEKKSLQRVTKRQKESIDANEWETLLQKTMTELDIMRKKIQACKKSHAVVSDEEEAKWKAVQCRHEQLKTTWRQLNQPDSVTATEKANAKLKLLKREKTLQRTDEGYYLQKAIHVQATTTHEVHRMQKQTARLQEAIAMAQSQLDTCAAECSELQRQINTKQGAFLPKLPNAKAVHPPVPTRVQSHASLPPIAVKKPHTGCDVPKKRMAVPPLNHTSRDKY